MTNEIILKNQIQCLKCLDVVESLHTHDFRWCSCKAVAVDGGRDYLRRVGEPENYKELSQRGVINWRKAGLALGKLLEAKRNKDGRSNPAGE
jgi:hypothetical protein